MNEQSNTNTENLSPAEQTQTTALGADTNTPPSEGNPPTTTTDPTTPAITVDDYKLEIEGFDFDTFKSDEGNKAFLEKLAEQGVSNDVLTTIIGEYQKHLGGLDGKINEMIEAQSVQTTESLQKEWGGDFGKNISFAKNALLNAGFTEDQFNDPKIGNNEPLIKLAMHFGSQMQEDAPPSNTQQSQGQSIQELMSSEAYNDPKHPQHQRVYQQVQAYYAKQYSQ